MELLAQVAKRLLLAVQLTSVFGLSLVPWQSCEGHAGTQIIDGSKELKGK